MDGAERPKKLHRSFAMPLFASATIAKRKEHAARPVENPQAT